MSKSHVKSGDEVVVLAGADKGKRGKVIEVQRALGRVIVEGVRVQKKHMKKSQMHPQGAIIEREGPIDISNVMLAEKFDARAARRGGGQAAEAAQNAEG